MARKKGARRKTPKPLLKRFTSKPIETSKAEWKKLPPVAKGIVALTAIGFTGIGALEVAGMGKVGKAVTPIIAWGAKLRAKLG